jgi:signal-transduction protein with cAMP-binding, CBS, and nucleotidyltransferase domain
MLLKGGLMSKLFDSMEAIERPVREFVTKRLIGVNKESSVQEAASRMVQFNISAVVIVEDEEVVGILTDADMKKKVVAKGLSPDAPVKEVMTKKLITVDINTIVKEVLEIMSKKKIKHILITEKGKITGILTFRDLIDMERQKLETYISRE